MTLVRGRSARGIACALFATAVVAGMLSCVATGESSTDDVAALRDGFEPVSEMLGARCGSLDCHGDGARSLRLYHHYGLRLSRDDFPGGEDTRSEEHEENFLSVIGLEPEATSDVAASGGEGFEHLTVYRKAFGLERHKGHRVLTPDSDAGRCLVSWLKGEVDGDRCEKAGAFERPSTPE